MLNQRAVFRVANKESSANVAACEIGAHVEFTGISWRCDHLGYAEEAQLIALFPCSTPAKQPARVRSVLPAFEFDRFKLLQECRKSVRRNLRLADHESRRCKNSWRVTNFSSKSLAFGVATL